MDKISLSAEKRKVLGKKVKTLRKKGILPASLYGKKIKSEAVSLNIKEFEKIYDKAGETGIIELSLANEVKPRPVLVKNLQVHPVTKEFLHTDLYQVDLKEKVKASIPLVLTGKAKAQEDKLGVLIKTLNEVEVEALPTDFPEHLEVDVTNLSKVDDQITVDKLKVPKDVAVLTSPGTIIVKVGPLITAEAKKEIEEKEKKTEAAATTETAPKEEEKTPVKSPPKEATP